MKIVNFIKHQKPVPCGRKRSYIQICSFDLEMIGDGAVFLWVGWSVRTKDGRDPFIQGPRIDLWSSTRRGNALVMPEIAAKLLLTSVRAQLKTKYGIDVPLPKPVANFTQRKKEKPNVDLDL